MTYSAIALAQYPKAMIDEATFVTKTLERKALNAGEYRVKITHLSLDPAMRGWVSPDRNSYIPPVELGETMRSLGFGVVIESQNEQYPVDSQVTGLTGWCEELVVGDNSLTLVPAQVDAQMALSVLGMPGLTAFIGYAEVLQAPSRQQKQPQTIVVTGAAGAVGSVVVQMAKADGLNVIALAGSDEKCQWLKDELGADTVINYKREDIDQAITLAAPKGIDLFFENTGGVAQHSVIDKINAHGKVAVCGLIADYHLAEPALAPSWINLIKRRASIEGFTITDHFHRSAELAGGVMQYLARGEIKSRVHLLQGLESAKLGVNMLYSGDNNGKLIVAL